MAFMDVIRQLIGARGKDTNKLKSLVTEQPQGSETGGKQELTWEIPETLGGRNNNPINLKKYDNWDGMTGTDKDNHVIFQDPEYGLRASLKNLYNRKEKQPNQTLIDYMDDFAEENHVKEANHIADTLGISVDTPLKDINMNEMIKPLAWFESNWILTDDHINKVRDKFGFTRS